MSSAARKAREALRDRAYRLGSIDAYAERPLRDMSDGGSAWLMDELGEHGPTTGRNADFRGRLCDAYEDGYRAAHSALGIAADIARGTPELDGKCLCTDLECEACAGMCEQVVPAEMRVCGQCLAAHAADVMHGTCPLCAVLPGWPHAADCPNRREGEPAYEDITRV